jgi:DNA-binding beta-propeller fold protein YncE
MKLRTSVIAFFVVRVAITPNGAFAYVPNYNSNTGHTVTVIRIVTNTVVDGKRLLPQGSNQE